MDVVVDTNVFFDALFKGDKNAELVLRNEHRGTYRFVLSDRMREELINVCLAHFAAAKLGREQIETPFKLLLRCMHRARHLNPVKQVNLSPHGPDNEFISCAIEAPTDYLITSNGEHFQIPLTQVLNNAGRPIRFLYPDQFNLEILRLSVSTSRR